MINCNWQGHRRVECNSSTDVWRTIVVTGGRWAGFLILRILSCGNHAGFFFPAVLPQNNQADWDAIFDDSITDLKIIMRGLRETPCQTFWHILCHPGGRAQCCVGPTRESNVVPKPSSPRLCHTLALPTRLPVDDKYVAGPARNRTVEHTDVLTHWFPTISLWFPMVADPTDFVYF